MFRKLFPFLLLFSALLLCPSCSDEEEILPHKLETSPHHVYKKIDADLRLEMGRKRLDYVSGKSGQKLSFLLTNKGLAPVSIEEWYMKDSDNLKLYCAVCEKGASASVKESDWFCAWPLKNTPAQGRNMPVRINPNSSLILDVPLDFLKNFPMNNRPVVTLAVYAELRLTSVSAKSPVYEIDIRPIVISL